MKGFARAEAQYENRTDECYCRGVNVCPDCEQHACTQCECEKDGAPATQEEVTSGYVNPSQARMAAWEQKKELTR